MHSLFQPTHKRQTDQDSPKSHSWRASQQLPAAHTRAPSHCNTQYPAPYHDHFEPRSLNPSKVRAAAGHHKPDLARATLAASRLRDPDYSLHEWHDDLLASLPELRMLHIPESRRSEATHKPPLAMPRARTLPCVLVAPQKLGTCASMVALGGSTPSGSMMPRGTQKLPRVLEAATFNVADIAVSGHAGASRARARQQICTEESWEASSLSTGSCALVSVRLSCGAWHGPLH